MHRVVRSDAALAFLGARISESQHHESDRTLRDAPSGDSIPSSARPSPGSALEAVADLLRGGRPALRVLRHAAVDAGSLRLAERRDVHGGGRLHAADRRSRAGRHPLPARERAPQGDRWTSSACCVFLLPFCAVVWLWGFEYVQRAWMLREGSAQPGRHAGPVRPEEPSSSSSSCWSACRASRWRCAASSCSQGASELLPALPLHAGMSRWIRS